MRRYLLLGLCLGLTLGAAGWGRAEAQAPEKPGVRIVSPLNNQIVPMGVVTVEIAADHFQLAGSNHWVLYVDGLNLGPVESGVTMTTTQLLESGPHQLEARLADAQNDNLASATIFVTAAPATPADSPFNLKWTAVVMGGLVVVVLALLWVGLRIAHPPAE